MIPFPFRDMEPYRVLAFPRWNERTGRLLGVQWRIYLEGEIEIDTTRIPDIIDSDRGVWGKWTATGAKITGVEYYVDKFSLSEISDYTIINAYSEFADSRRFRL